MANISLITEHSRFAYGEDLSNGCLDIELSEQLIWFGLLANFDSKQPHDEVCISIRNIAEVTGKRIDNVRSTVAKAYLSLGSKPIYKIDLEAKKKRKEDLAASETNPIFSVLRFDPELDIVIAKFNPAVVPLLIPASQSPLYKLTTVYGFTSGYSFRYLALLVWRFIHEGPDFYISMTELLAKIVSPVMVKGNKSLFQTKNFKQSVHELALRDINTLSFLAVEAEEVTGKENRSRGRPKIIGFNYHVEEKPGQSVETFSDKGNMEHELINRGFTVSLAKKTIIDYSWNTIRRNIAYFDAHVKKGGKDKLVLGKFLYTFIKDDEEKKNRRTLTVVSPVENAQAIGAMGSLFEIEEPAGEIDPESSFLKEFRNKFPTEVKSPLRVNE